MKDQTHKEYLADLEQATGKCTYDNCRPLSELELKKFQKKQRERERRLEKAEFCLEVNDDSMNGQSSKGHYFPKGSNLYVASPSAEQIQSGSYVIATCHGSNNYVFRMIVKKNNSWSLEPLNANYPEIKKNFTVMGKVIDADIAL